MKTPSLFLKTMKSRTGSFLFYSLMAGWAIISLFPFLFMIIMATKSWTQVIALPPKLYIDWDFMYNIEANYYWLISNPPFWRAIWNSFYIAFMSTGLTVLICSLAAYAFAVFEFRHKELLFNLIIATMLIPPVINVIPYFSMMGAIGWAGTPRSIYLPTLANALGIFLLRRHIESDVPRDLLNMAKLDGCTDLQIYYKIVLPLIKPGLGVLMLITFLTSWNSYLYPMAILNDMEQHTIPLMINRIGNMLAISICILPILLIFLLFSRWIMTSTTEGLLKD